jgi:hypothetical protein
MAVPRLWLSCFASMAFTVIASAAPPEFYLHTFTDNFWGAASVHACDIDGDGDLDVLGAARGVSANGFADGSVIWWENDGTYPWAAHPWPMHVIITDWADARSAHAADFDKDGDLDVVAAAHGTSANGDADGEVRWWENLNGRGTEWASHVIDGDFLRSYSVQAGDVDGDGNVDVIGVSTGAIQLPNPPPYDGEVVWWQNNGNAASWTKRVLSANEGGPDWVRLADVNGDSRPEVLTAHSYDRKIACWDSSNPPATQWTERTVASGHRALSVFAADIDGDNDNDILGTDVESGEIFWVANENNGSSWTEHPVGDGFSQAFAVAAADLDGDGDNDVIGADRHWQTGRVTWWENVGGDGTTWVERNLAETFGGGRDLFPVDIDNDGDIDVLGAGETAGALAWWENLSEEITSEGEGVAEGEGAPEGEGEGVAEGEGATEGEGEGMAEGEGAPEGEGEGMAEGEGATEGEGEGMAEGEGATEGEGEGDIEIPDTFTVDLVLGSFFQADTDHGGELTYSEVVSVIAFLTPETFLALDSNNDTRVTVGELLALHGPRVLHSADHDGDRRLNLTEVLRVIQLYNARDYGCVVPPGASEDGFAPGAVGKPIPGQCYGHASDFRGGDGVISLSELLRSIQIFNAGGYAWCPSGNTEDDYCPN